jgi:protein farnesyltransferase subunit beta
VNEVLRLQRTAHIAYLHTGLGKLPSGFASLDASRPWITYWIVHSLALLGADLPSEGPSASDIIAFLQSCQATTGGFGGGPQQIAHLAPTYAATAALVTLGGEEALRAVDRAAMADFLNRMAVPASQGGGFRVHEGQYARAATAHQGGGPL